MTTVTRRGVLATVTAIVLVALGVGVSAVVGDALGISATPSQQMSPAAPTVPVVAAPVAPPALVVRAPDTVRMSTAIDELDQAEASVARRSGAATTVTAGSAIFADDSYTLTGSASALRIEAASETGAVRGVYDLAASIRAGRSVAEGLGEKVTSKLPFRMAGLRRRRRPAGSGAVAERTDYSHASGAFEDAYLPHAPYVDATGSPRTTPTGTPTSVTSSPTATTPSPGRASSSTRTSPRRAFTPRATSTSPARRPSARRSRRSGTARRRSGSRCTCAPTCSPSRRRSTRISSAASASTPRIPALWKVYTDALDELYAQSPDCRAC